MFSRKFDVVSFGGAVVDVFLNTEFTKEERHIRRLRKIEEYENGNPNT